jgi:uncharacterized protein (TIGR02611 family)
VALAGATVIALGLLLIPLPGPGWVVVFLGLGILATEFAWAERLLAYARTKLRAWTAWVARQALPARLAIGAAALLMVAGTAGAYLAWQGIPFVSD